MCKLTNIWYVSWFLSYLYFSQISARETERQRSSRMEREELERKRYDDSIL